MKTLGKLCLLGLLACGSVASAQSWENITGNLPGAISTSNIGPMDTDGSRLYVLGERGVFVSTDGGASFQAVNTVAGASYSLGDYGFRFIGKANGEMWIGADPASAAHPQNGGLATLHRLTPGGTTWTKSSAGFPVLTIDNQADDIAYDATTGTYYCLAAIGGAFVSSDGTTWTQSNNGQGGFGLPSSLVALNGVVLSSRPIGGIRRSTDKGATWTLASAGGVINGLNGAGHLVYHNGRVILPFSDGSLTYVNGVPSTRQGIVFSDDLGMTWTYSPKAAIAGADAQSDGTTVFFGGTHYSATGGVTSDPLDQTGVSGAPRRIIRIGNTLFMLTSTGLFRRDIGTLDLRASTQIVVHPINSPTLIDGDSYTFSVLAGGENVTYQWKKGTTDIPGATGPKLTLNPVMAADSGSYSVVVTGDLGTLTSSSATLTVQTPEDGKDDPTFPQSPATRSTALLAVLDDYTVVENDANFLQRYGDSGLINSRSFPNRFFYQTLDRAGRLVLADDVLGNPGRVIRIDPKTLADDPTFTPFVLDANVGFTAVEELPGRGYLLAPERNGTRNKLPLNSVMLIDYQGNLDPRFDTGDAGQVSFRREVSSIAVTEDGSIITWDGNNLIRLNHDGSPDTAFAPTPKGPVWAVSGNRVMTYHQFSFGVRSLVALNPDGTVDPAFNPNRLGFNQNPADLVEQLDGKLIVVGNFTSYGGESVVEQVRINTDGTRDTSFYDGAGYPSGYPTDVAYDPRGFAYLSPSATGSSYRYQDSNKQGLIRIFTSRADFGIWRQSAGGDVSRNDTHRLSVIAYGTGLTYQWFKNGAPISGATSSVLTIAPAVLIMA
jgi:hypothetical protein